MRAIGIVDKMMQDEECSQFSVAVGIAISAVASHVLNDQMIHELQEQGVSRPLADSIAEAAMRNRCNGISDMVREWYESEKETRINALLDEVIERVNKRRSEEANLPKGD